MSEAPVWVQDGYWWAVTQGGQYRIGHGSNRSLPAEADRAEALQQWLTDAQTYDDEQWRRRRLAAWSPSRVPIQTHRPKISAQSDRVAVVTMTEADLVILLRRAADVATEVALAKFAEMEPAGQPAERVHRVTVSPLPGTQVVCPVCNVAIKGGEPMEVFRRQPLIAAHEACLK